MRVPRQENASTTGTQTGHHQADRHHHIRGCNECTIHATSGRLIVYIDPDAITLLTQDIGAGIEDIDLAMKEGYSTATYEIREMGFGAGMGLSNIKQCSDELYIESKVGVGTNLEAKVFLKDQKKTGGDA